MNVEFTQDLTTDNWKEIRIAINERADNINNESLSKEKQKLLKKIQTRPEHVVYFKEFCLLLEMTAQTKKLWKPTENLKVYFFGEQDNRTQKVIEHASIWSIHCSIRFQTTSKIEEAKT